MSVLIPPLATFFVYGLAALVLGWLFTRADMRELVKNRMRKTLAGTRPRERSILRQDLGKEDWLQNLVKKLSPAESLERLFYQANIKMPITVFVLTSLILAFLGFGLVNLTTQLFGVSLVMGGLAGLSPLFVVRVKANARMAVFQRQLPDALDLIGRALRAGHGFNTGMRMVADEFDDPLGPEFLKTMEEINIGVSPELALRNLTDRVNCPDLMFFTVSVNIQRETGGNLSEIVNNIAGLVRDRFKLQGQIKTLSAEGRLSAWVLLALPFFAALALSFLNPNYMKVLITHPLGKKMLMTSGGIMLMGIFVVRRLIKIEV